MKILDWVHRKLQPATKYSRVSHKNAPAFEHDAVDRIDPAHRSTAVGTEPDIETPLLLNVNLAGILTIGTLGYSHPLFLPHTPEEPTLELPEENIQAAAKLPRRTTLPPPVTESLVMKTEHSAFKVHRAEEKIMAEPLLKEDMERKERTTLGDLLAIERAVTLCGQPTAGTGSTLKSKFVSDLKKGGKEKKKKGEELELAELQSPAATERIQRMIKRMVKKKIHPEAAAKGKKGGGEADVAADLILIGCGGGGGGGGGGGNSAIVLRTKERCKSLSG